LCHTSYRFLYYLAKGREEMIEKNRRVKWLSQKAFDEMHKQHIVIDTHSIHNIMANAARLQRYT
jgi:hypothetical protein